jgi:integrase
MGVYKRPSCEWKNGKPTWYFQFHHQKVRYYDGIYTTKKEAHDAEQAKRNELRSKRSKPIPKSKATFSEFVPRFIEHRKVTTTGCTAAVEERKSKNIERSFGKMRITNISISDINEYVAAKNEDGYSNRSINLDLTFLRSFFKHAIECNVTDYNPAKEVSNLRETKTEKWSPTKEELQRFADCAAETTYGKFIVPWIWFRAYTGTRPTESFYMEWDDIDFENDRIHIRPKKGNPLKNGKFRVVDLHPELKPILLAWRDEWQEIHERWQKRNIKEMNRTGRELLPDHQWVFINPKSHGRRAQRFSKSLYAAREAAGLPEMTPHTLRHYFISQCVMSGINFFTIAKWVGHTDTKLIETVYGHLNADFRREQMAMLKVV